MPKAQTIRKMRKPSASVITTTQENVSEETVLSHISVVSASETITNECVRHNHSQKYRKTRPQLSNQETHQLGNQKKSYEIVQNSNIKSIQNVHENNDSSIQNVDVFDHVNDNMQNVPINHDVVTPINVKALNQWLQGYDKNKRDYLIDGFTFGFQIPFKGERKFRSCENLKSATENLGILKQKIEVEVVSGRVGGPYTLDNLPFNNIQIPPGSSAKAKARRI